MHPSVIVISPGDQVTLIYPPTGERMSEQEATDRRTRIKAISGLDVAIVSGVSGVLVRRGEEQ